VQKKSEKIAKKEEEEEEAKVGLEGGVAKECREIR